jgi:hypothetical protein
METESEFCTEILSHDQSGEKRVQCEKSIVLAPCAAETKNCES